MKIALVHDYIKEFGGAERVLLTLSEMFPNAPIYTAFKVSGSTAAKEFKNKKIIESKFAPILKIGNLYSPLRFLIPAIWRSFDLSSYDLVITCKIYLNICLPQPPHGLPHAFYFVKIAVSLKMVACEENKGVFKRGVFFIDLVL